MPSSLTRVHSRALGFSPHLPVSDCGTDMIDTSYEVFLGSVIGPLPTGFPAVVSAFELTLPRICLEEHPYGLSPGQPLPGRLTFLRHPLGLRNSTSSGILTGCPSSTPFGLDLGPTDPEPTNVAQGTLRFSATRILTLFLATYSDILTS